MTTTSVTSTNVIVSALTTRRGALKVFSVFAPAALLIVWLISGVANGSIQFGAAVFAIGVAGKLLEVAVIPIRSEAAWNKFVAHGHEWCRRDDDDIDDDDGPLYALGGLLFIARWGSLGLAIIGLTSLDETWSIWKPFAVSFGALSICAWIYGGIAKREEWVEAS